MVLPANLETLQNLIDEHMGIAKKIYDENGEVRPMIIGYSHKDRILIPLSFKNNAEKEYKLKVATMIFATNNVVRYTVGYEAWLLQENLDTPEYNRLKKEGLRISDSSLKIEVLMCIAVSRNEVLTVTNKILEDRSLEEFYKDSDFTRADGIFCNLLPPKDLSENDIRNIKMIMNRMMKMVKLDFDRESFE